MTNAFPRTRPIATRTPAAMSTRVDAGGRESDAAASAHHSLMHLHREAIPMLAAVTFTFLASLLVIAWVALTAPGTTTFLG